MSAIKRAAPALATRRSEEAKAGAARFMADIYRGNQQRASGMADPVKAPAETAFWMDKIQEQVAAAGVADLNAEKSKIRQLELLVKLDKLETDIAARKEQETERARKDAEAAEAASKRQIAARAAAQRAAAMGDKAAVDEYK